MSRANKHEIGHEAEHHHGASGGRRDVDVVDRDRHGEEGAHAADLQPQLRNACCHSCRRAAARARSAVLRACESALSATSKTGAGRPALKRAGYSGGTMSTTGGRAVSHDCPRAPLSVSELADEFDPCDSRKLTRPGVRAHVPDTVSRGGSSDSTTL